MKAIELVGNKGEKIILRKGEWNMTSYTKFEETIELAALKISLPVKAIYKA